MELSKRENKRTIKKKRIVDAALKVFASKGYNNSKISDISKAAGIAIGTIYIYFEKKDDIIISLFEDIMKRFNVILDKELVKDSDPNFKLKVLIRTHLELLAKNKELAGILAIELRQSSKFLKDYDNPEFKKYIGTIKCIIEKGQEQKVFRDDIPSSLIWKIIFGVLDQISLAWVLSTDKDDEYLIKQINSVITFIFDGILIKEEKWNI